MILCLHSGQSIAAFIKMISPRFLVGFSGHRRLGNPDAIVDAIRAGLEQLRVKAKAAGGDIELFASIAYGADTLAVETARSLGIAVHLILPKPVEIDPETQAVDTQRGFASDFWDKSPDGARTFRQKDWDRSWKQIQDAQKGVDGGTLRLVHGSVTTSECYYDTGVQELNACDALLAVWDGKDARGIGGTAEMIAHVRATKPERAILIIDAKDATIRPELLEIFASTSELRMKEIEMLNTLMSEHCKEPAKASGDIYECLSKTAKDEAKKFRSSLVQTIFLHGSATIIAAFATILPKTTWLGWALPVVAFCELVLVVQAWRLSHRHLQRHTHERWLRARFGAELVRGIRAAAAFQDPVSLQIAVHKPRWSRFALTVSLMAAREVDRSKPWQKHRNDYLKQRIEDQIGYFNDKLGAATRTYQRTQNIAAWATKLAPICVFIAFVAKIWHVFHHEAIAKSFAWDQFGTNIVIMFLPIAIPLVAAIATGLRAALDTTRRTHRYSELAERLTATSRGLGELKTETSVRRTVAATEEVLLDELVEWHLAEQQNAGH